MPIIKQKPSLNFQEIKKITKQELIDMHPLADEDHLSMEWDKANGKTAEIETKAAKKKD
jgi:hypothetical protein